MVQQNGRQEFRLSIAVIKTEMVSLWQKERPMSLKF